jgi:hypothetical protein
MIQDDIHIPKPRGLGKDTRVNSGTDQKAGKIIFDDL